MVNQSTDTIEVQIGKPMNFLLFTIININELVLIVELMIQRQLHYQGPLQHG